MSAEPRIPPPVDLPLERAMHDALFDRLQPDRFRLPETFHIAEGQLGKLTFSVGQTVLGIGGGRAAPILAWYRRFKLAEYRRRSGFFGAFLFVLRQPLRVARDVHRQLLKSGPAVSELYGVTLVAQALQMLRLGLFRNLYGETFYRFKLWLPERSKTADLHLQYNEAGLFYRVLAFREARSDFLILDDKARFEDWCNRHQLPTVQTVCTVPQGERMLDGIKALVCARGCNLFSKPIGGNKGLGARKWMASGSMWLDETGQAYDEKALLTALSRQAVDGSVVLQKCLSNHSTIGKVSNTAVCTLRILTSRAPGGLPEIVSVVFRMGVGESWTDNFSAGGVAAAVDIDTGTLTTAVRLHPVFHVSAIERHPDSGVVLQGFVLPYAADAQSIVLKAHSMLESISVVGWDVALTSDGPVLIEGNFNPGSTLAQAPSGVPLGATNHLSHLEAQLRHTYKRRE